MFKSGDSLNGTMNETEAEGLKMWYKSRRMELGEFNDTKGVIIVDSSQIVAVVINKCEDTNPAGFTTNIGQEPKKGGVS
jgi:hypothetical protein